MNEHQDYEMHKCDKYPPRQDSGKLYVIWLDGCWNLFTESGTHEVGIDVYIQISYCPFCGEKLE